MRNSKLSQHAVQHKDVPWACFYHVLRFLSDTFSIILYISNTVWVFKNVQLFAHPGPASPRYFGRPKKGSPRPGDVSPARGGRGGERPPKEESKMGS